MSGKDKIGISYMGSKRKLASQILHIITQRHPNTTDFYDLFGGGGSVSFTAIRDYRFNVHYNELNAHIYCLVKYLCENKTLDPKFYEWVTREEFFRQCARTDADWYSGFVMSCWSFGNKQSSYIYGSDIEELKRKAHEFIVNGDLDCMSYLNLDIPQLLNIKDIQQRRIYFCNYIKKNENDRLDIEILERMVQLERISHLQNLKNLKYSNISYEHVTITGTNPVIYCDIPYKGTGEYKEGGFDHDAFYAWANDCPHPVYISEYAAHFHLVHSFKHRSSLSATNNKKQVVEKLFWNGKGDALKTELF